MSRLKGLHIPFVQGVDDRIDAKLLPDGTLSDLRNGRMRKAGSLALRRGWRPLDMSVVDDEGVQVTGGNVIDLYSYDRSLVALSVLDQQDPLRLQVYAQAQANIPWVIRRGVGLPPATVVRSVGNVPDLPDDVDRASAALTSDGVYGAVLLSTELVTVLRVFKVATDETLYYGRLSSGADVRKVVSMGSTFGIVRNTGSALTLSRFNPAALSSGIVLVGTLVTATVTHFDVGVASETTPTALHVVYTVAGAITYAQFTFAGAQTGSDKAVLASGGQAAYVASDDVTAHVVYQDTPAAELSLLSFAATGAFTTSAGPTALNAGVAVDPARFAIGYTPNSNSARSIHVAAALTTASTVNTHTVSSSHGTNTIVRFDSSDLISGWVTKGHVAGFGIVRGGSAALDTLYTDQRCSWFVGSYRLGRNPDQDSPPYAPGMAPTGDALVVLNRTSDASVTSSVGDGAQASTQTTMRTFRVVSTERRPAVEFGGALYITGGMLTQWTAGGLTENGILRPVIRTTTPANSTGSVGAGDYQYRAIVTWTDESGRLHRSVVSDAVDETVTAPEDTVTVTVHVPKTLRRDPNLVADPTVELYRTEAGPGELFYLVASAKAEADDAIDLVDELVDANIIDNKRLYTEGEFGAISGALDVTPPNPSAFAAVMRDRIVVAGVGPDYQVSQTALPEEPVAFTQPGVSGPVALAYQDSVEGRITGVATLDDTIVLGTATKLYVAGGEGPNLAGVGEFQSPARLPTDVGFYDARSIIEDADGLWFLGDADKLYTLPRGQGAPVFAGEQVQDRFAAAVVGAGRDVEDGVTAWAVADATLVLRHSPAGQWATDSLPFTPVAFISHQGRFYAADSAGDVWEQSASAYGDGASGATSVALRAVTGDVQVFGQAGWGRLACVEVLGEFQAAAALLAEISYDMGLTWTTLGTHTVTGLSAGQGFQRQWHPARQRGGKFRVRVTMTPSVSTTEGCRLTGCTVYFDQRSGQTRLDSAKRR